LLPASISCPLLERKAPCGVLGMSQPKAQDARLLVMAMPRCSGLSVQLWGSCLETSNTNGAGAEGVPERWGICSRQSRGVVLVGQHKSGEQIRVVKMYQKNNH